LIEQFIGAAGPMFVQHALRFGSAKPRAIGIGERRGCFPLGSFLDTFKIDQIRHASTHYRYNRQRASLSGRARMHEAVGGSLTIKNAVLTAAGCYPKSVRHWRNKITKLQTCRFELINPRRQGI
jgi:hypothetical protein